MVSTYGDFVLTTAVLRKEEKKGGAFSRQFQCARFIPDYI